MSWLDNFKIAIANKDSEKILLLIDSMPSNFKTVDDMLSALSLTKEALNLINFKKDSLANDIKKLKSVRKYADYYQ
ncbi:Uncharacterised protein [Campylobacter sputorum subsp. bubulus]|uniref:Uncharacterized protein n=1 Tax=Campylobacter sputorum subsp. sputorum TaxID=32024 RepID=A0A381DIA0_9BACT|nr:hypothetical protein [Campylobacter sputorum]ASM35240.1 hypothetical protein CSPUT_1033 [Campylobacter sputorum aubsp. sputorum RM3237]ASM36918.1 hypothetical protein CSF_1051 [Campylobacter sputorum bv. faecalis CCUG 20703]KAB0580858.1 hypothetical protein F7P64_08020 [Campylobacter sputorum subsp. sputorum]QEL05431.1 hypothetical protein CSPT_1031 [Campylobacter sputorum subsp. sputorum]SUX08754.1 Uncharacterised protein [Campylobacter sputorum subsp. bubulus]